MLIKLSKKLIEDIDDGKLKRFGIDTERLRYGNTSLSIEVDDMEQDLLKELQRIVSRSKVFGAKSCARDIQYWLESLEEVEKTGDASGFADMKVRKVEFFAQYLRSYFKNKKGYHRVYVRDEKRGVTFCSYIYDIDYHPAKHERDYTYPEYVSLDLAWMEFGEQRSQTYTFEAHECSHFAVVRESLRRKGIYFADKALDKQYEESVKKFNEIGWNVGEQYLATGVGTNDVDIDEDRWWRRYSDFRLDREGEPTNVVIDVFKESDKESSGKSRRDTIERSWWAALNEEDELEGNIQEELPVHPMLVVFVLKKHMRLRVHVDQLVKYKYDESMGRNLILPEDSANLIKTLVSWKGGFQDIIKNKGGGAIVLCTGGPGTGKTLTSEVYAEVMKKPLYTIQCSQLGVDPEELEEELLKIFARSQRWDAILLLDEADVYIRERGDDLNQNAIVGVFLRVMEYYHGVMFMTTNRPDVVDDAIASRCIARIDYSNPESAEAAKKIWKVQAAVQGMKISDATIGAIIKKFGYDKLSGRDIKSLVKLARLNLKGKEIDLKTIMFVKKFKPTK